MINGFLWPGPKTTQNSNLSPYCGTLTSHPNLSLMCPAIAFAASGSPCVKNVRRGPFFSSPSNHRSTSRPIRGGRKPSILRDPTTHWNPLTEDLYLRLAVTDSPPRSTRCLVSNKHQGRLRIRHKSQR